MGRTTAIVLESQSTRGGVVSPWLVDVSIPNAWKLCEEEDRRRRSFRSQTESGNVIFV